MTKRLHHMAFRCRDTEETRAFYEEVIGLPLTSALRIEETKTGRRTKVLHSFFGLEDGSSVAFFEDPDTPFDFKDQRDFDLHIALESDETAIGKALAAAKAKGLTTRGPSDHGFITSWYFRDPNGYVVELTVKTPQDDGYGDREKVKARALLADWLADRA
jgi:catechol 2,3-dioxygenase-like lactoylglutathione lyase family enzyme